jgi:tRNA (adenine22-N1)-methyltransferase
MSGALMQRLCDAAPDVLREVQQLVIQPNKDAELMRAWAREHGWHLRDEHMLQARGRFFVVCAFVPGSGADPAYELAGWTEAALLRLGPLLARRKDAVALRFCEAQRTRLADLVAEGVAGYEPELAGFQTACDLLSLPLLLPLSLQGEGAGG